MLEENKNLGINQQEKSSSKIENDYVRLQKKDTEIENKASKLVRYLIRDF